MTILCWGAGQSPRCFATALYGGVRTLIAVQVVAGP